MERWGWRRVRADGKGRHWWEDKIKGTLNSPQSHIILKGIIIHEGQLARWKMESRTIEIAWAAPNGGEQYPYWENIHWSELVSVICNTASALLPSLGPTRGPRIPSIFFPSANLAFYLNWKNKCIPPCSLLVSANASFMLVIICRIIMSLFIFPFPVEFWQD